MRLSTLVPLGLLVLLAPIHARSQYLSLPARAFGDGPIPVVTPGRNALTLHIEPERGSFRLEDVEPWPVTLRSAGTGTIDEIACVEAGRIMPDSDGNGAPELIVTFKSEGDEAGPLRISPNPFNPDAIVTFSTSRSGPGASVRRARADGPHRASICGHGRRAARARAVGPR
jgi:hypothetical protein